MNTYMVFVYANKRWSYVATVEALSSENAREKVSLVNGFSYWFLKADLV